MKKNVLLIGSVVLLSLLGGWAGSSLYSYSHTGSLQQSNEVGQYGVDAFGEQPKERKTLFSLSSGGSKVPDNFVEAATSAVNGVVHIRSEKIVRQSQMRNFIDPFEFFFGIPSPDSNRQLPQRGNRNQNEVPKAVAIGSGVIISPDGYIITNNHVIDGADNLFVTTNDNEEFKAKVIGADPLTDIALIKIDAKNLHAIPFGDSESIQVGEWVLAVGNPFNLSSTVTAGIVSAKGRRTIGGDLKIASFIQTDAAVNSGNSGGALVNTKGELIGINTMIYSQTGSYAGYSFAVPMSIARKVVTDLQKYGAVQRAVLGVVGGNITHEIKKEFDLKVNEGAVIVDFPDKSPAKQAGLEKGDVITTINGITIRSMAELQEQIAKLNPGNVVKLEVDRKGKSLSFELELKNQEGNTDLVKKMSVAGTLGAAFLPLTKEEQKHYGISYGVKVVGISDGKLRDAGIRKGFIILAINNIKVETSKDVESITEAVLKESSDKVLFIKGMDEDGDVKYVAVDLR